MAVPDYQSLMLPVLVASSKGEVRIGSVVEELADQLALTSEERSELLPSGKQTVFSNRVHWAKSYLSQADLVEITRRGYFKITPRGESVLASHPSHIDAKFLAQFAEFRQFRERSSVTDQAESGTVAPALDAQKQTPDETMRLAHRPRALLPARYAAPAKNWVSLPNRPLFRGRPCGRCQLPAVASRACFGSKRGSSLPRPSGHHDLRYSF
jgi:restriction endonuclease Mrr